MYNKKTDIIITAVLFLICVIVGFSIHIKTKEERQLELKKEGLNEQQIDSVLRYEEFI